MRVAIIGAGPSGLCSARHLAALFRYFDVKVFEKGSKVGGTWVYSEDRDEKFLTSSSLSSVHSSMYKNLRTNLPKEIMNFPEFPFSSHLPSFPGHYDVREYLQQYAEQYDLLQHITFRTRIEEIKPLSHEIHEDKKSLTKNEFDSMKWKVTSRNLDSGKQTSEVFQAVFICTGHFSCPDCPKIPGMDLVPNDKVLHSHSYRDPEMFKNQNVLIVGAGQSGRDIAVDLSNFCKDVYICNRRDPFTSKFPSNVHEMPSIKQLRGDLMVDFSDNRSVQVDSVVVATGYRYAFPFLSKDIVHVECAGKRVMPLYKHTFNAHYPSLVFVGANMDMIFPMLDFQIRWIIAVLTGKKALPSSADMINDTEAVFQRDLKLGAGPQWAGHYIGSAMFDLIKIWAELGNTPLLPPVFKKVYEDAVYGRLNNIMHYKKADYYFLDDENWLAKMREVKQ